MTAWKTGTAAVRFLQGLFLSCLLAGCGTSKEQAASDSSQAEAAAAAAEAEAKDECRDRLNAAVRRVAPESLATQTRRDSVVNALNSWLASCGEADVKALAVSEANAALLSEGAVRTARAVRFSENDVIYIRDSMLLKGLTESVWKQIPAGADQAAAEVQRVTSLFRYIVRNLALTGESENRVPVGLYESLLTGRGSVDDRIWAFSEALRQRQIDSLILQPQTPPAAAGTFAETAERLVAVVLGAEVLLFDPLRGVPVPRADDSGVLPKSPAGLAEISGLERWKTAAVLVPSHPSAAAPRMLVLQQRLDAADSLVLYEELAGGTSEIRRESIDVSKLLTDPNLDESKLSDDEKNAMKAEAISKLLERSDALFGRPSRRLLQARVSQIAGNFELGMIQELQQIRIACLQEVVELEFVDEGKQAVGRIRLPETILSVQRSAVGDTLYWTAMSQVSRGDAGTAVQTLRNYRRQYPDEKMKFASLLLEAELLVEIGDVAGSAAVLKEAATDDNPERGRQEWMLARILSATAGETPATPVESPAAESPATPATPDAAAAGAPTPDPSPAPADNGQSVKP